jgi:hypothetical protein
MSRSEAGKVMLQKAMEMGLPEGMQFEAEQALKVEE